MEVDDSASNAESPLNDTSAPRIATIQELLLVVNYGSQPWEDLWFSDKDQQISQGFGEFNDNTFIPWAHNFLLFITTQANSVGAGMCAKNFLVFIFFILNFWASKIILGHYQLCCGFTTKRLGSGRLGATSSCTNKAFHFYLSISNLMGQPPWISTARCFKARI